MCSVDLPPSLRHEILRSDSQLETIVRLIIQNQNSGILLGFLLFIQITEIQFQQSNGDFNGRRASGTENLAQVVEFFGSQFRLFVETSIRDWGRHRVVDSHVYMEFCRVFWNRKHQRVHYSLKTTCHTWVGNPEQSDMDNWIGTLGHSTHYKLHPFLWTRLEEARVAGGHAFGANEIWILQLFLFLFPSSVWTVTSTMLSIFKVTSDRANVTSETFEMPWRTKSTLVTLKTTCFVEFST